MQCVEGLDHMVECGVCQANLEAAVFAADEALAWYVPSDLLVARIIRASNRRRPRFRMAAHLLPAPADVRPRLTHARAAAVVIAAIGLRPGALAAAVAAHVVFVAAAGVWLGAHLGPVFQARPASARPIASIAYVHFTLPANVSAIPGDTTRGSNERRIRQAVLDSLNHTYTFAGGASPDLGGNAAALANVARLMMKYPQIRLRLEADSSTAAHQWALVVKEFLAARGVRAGRVNVARAAAATGRQPTVRIVVTRG